MQWKICYALNLKRFGAAVANALLRQEGYASALALVLILPLHAPHLNAGPRTPGC